MKLRALHLAAAAPVAILAAAAIISAPAPSVRAPRKLAVVHMHPSAPRASQPAPAMLHAPQEQAVPASGTLPPRTLTRPAPTARPLRPVFPWWFHRRHVAVAQPAIA